MQIDIEKNPPSLHEIQRYQRVLKNKSRVQITAAVLLWITAIIIITSITLHLQPKLDGTLFGFNFFIPYREDVWAIFGLVCAVLGGYLAMRSWDGSELWIYSPLDPIDDAQKCLDFLALGRNCSVTGAYVEKLKAIHRAPLHAEYQAAKDFEQSKLERAKRTHAQNEFQSFKQPANGCDTNLPA